METPLRQFRRERKLTLRELAEKTGMLESHLSRLERGDAGLSVASALKIMEATGLTLEQLAPQADAA